mmetsp:Transcript_35659/g.82939  ORF Transcript_35659/g.82939 Transcript_35659/m.82939 type:complete len:464 (-) Transcript_35659:83-1474(-)
MHFKKYFCSVTCQFSPSRSLLRCEPHGRPRRRQRSLRHLPRGIRPLPQHPVQIPLVLPHLIIFLLHRLQVRHDRIRQQRLELSPVEVGHLVHDGLARSVGLHGGIDVEEVGRLGARGVVPLDPRLGVGLAGPNLFAEKVGGVQDVDAGSVAGVRLGHLGGSVREAHDPRPLLDDHGLGLREDRTAGKARRLGPLFEFVPLAVLVVEPPGDVPGELEVLALILPHRHPVCLVEQDVRGHEDGIGEETHAHSVALFAGLLLVLDHSLEPVHGSGAVEQPRQLRVGRDVGLNEHFGFGGVDPGREVERGAFVGTLQQLVGIVRLGCDRVQVHHAEKILRHLRDLRHSARLLVRDLPDQRNAQRVLQVGPLLDGSEVVAQMDRSGRLHAREDAPGDGAFLRRGGSDGSVGGGAKGGAGEASAGENAREGEGRRAAGGDEEEGGRHAQEGGRGRGPAAAGRRRGFHSG